MREVYRRTVNLESSEGARFSLITEESDFLPRSLWVVQLPEVQAGQQLSLQADERILCLFDPAMPRSGGCPNRRWRPHWEQWHELLEGEELECVKVSLEQEGIFSLCGLGPGSTPAGDDYISGWITAHWRVFGDTSPELSSFYRRWEQGSTTWLSGWIIRDALDGKIWKRGRDLLAALDGDCPSQLQKALGAILSWGHTSGLAWLAGLGDGLTRESG